MNNHRDTRGLRTVTRFGDMVPHVHFTRVLAVEIEGREFVATQSPCLRRLRQVKEIIISKMSAMGVKLKLQSCLPRSHVWS